MIRWLAPCPANEAGCLARHLSNSCAAVGLSTRVHRRPEHFPDADWLGVCSLADFENLPDSLKRHRRLFVVLASAAEACAVDGDVDIFLTRELEFRRAGRKGLRARFLPWLPRGMLYRLWSKPQQPLLLPLCCGELGETDESFLDVLDELCRQGVQITCVYGRSELAAQIRRRLKQMAGLQLVARHGLGSPASRYGLLIQHAALWLPTGAGHGIWAWEALMAGVPVVGAYREDLWQCLPFAEQCLQAGKTVPDTAVWIEQIRGLWEGGLMAWQGWREAEMVLQRLRDRRRVCEDTLRAVFG